MLEVEIATSNGTVICAPKGNLDATTVTSYRGAVALCMGEPRLIIDLSGVQLIDGAGLTSLVGTVRRAQDHRTRVAVVVPAGTLRKVLDEAGLDLVVSVSETVDLALAGIHDDARTTGGVHRPGKCDELSPANGGSAGDVSGLDVLSGKPILAGTLTVCEQSRPATMPNHSESASRSVSSC